jgi:mono/diheme cytochrome c family protein
MPISGSDARRLILLAAATLLVAGVASSRAQPREAGAREDPAAVRRGEYLARAGNCITCHTGPGAEETAPLAGGRAIPTPFGTFYGTNITPHPEHGLGAWSLGDFERAMRSGRAPDGSHYYPAFPYPAFTLMTDADVADLWAYLRSVRPIPQENRPHEISRLVRVRAGLAVWKRVNFREGRFEPDPARDELWNRGAYLSRALAHCNECHTPRTFTGGLDRNRAYGGLASGPDGEVVPNITPHETGIADWRERHLVRYLRTGMDPTGDFAGGSMADVIEHGTGHLDDDDLRAIARYILSLPAIDNDVRRGR